MNIINTVTNQAVTRKVRRQTSGAYGSILAAMLMALSGCGAGENAVSQNAVSQSKSNSATATAETEVAVYKNATEHPPQEAPPGVQLQTEFVNRDGDVIGEATVSSNETGIVIEYQLSGLEPGKHGFHIHEQGKCDAPAFTSAGGHFAPEDNEHGSPVPHTSEAHAGDMRNQYAATDGVMSGRIVNRDVVLSGGDLALIDADGAALVVHQNADDYRSQPSGDAGPRVACAPITGDLIQLSSLPETS